MDITVILCTYNRCKRLATALESVAPSLMPDSLQWNVLVIDNNSPDETRAVVEGFCQRYPNRFRYIFEPKQGKSNALNTGIRETDADILAFMDDDVEVDSNWLFKLTSVLSDRQWSGVGGRIHPETGFIPPAWLETKGRYALAPLAIFDLGSEAGRLDEPPFGTNMAFRKEMFAKYGDFRTDLGPQPGSEIRSEDTEFGARLLAGGERLWYEPSAMVYHSISRDRIRKEYFLRWWFDKARADVREFGTGPRTSLNIAGVPLFLFRRLFAGILGWMFGLSAGRRFSSRLKVWKVTGMIEECHRLSIEKKTMDRSEAPVGGHSSDIHHN